MYTIITINNYERLWRLLGNLEFISFGALQKLNSYDTLNYFQKSIYIFTFYHYSNCLIKSSS